MEKYPVDGENLDNNEAITKVCCKNTPIVLLDRDHTVAIEIPLNENNDKTVLLNDLKQQIVTGNNDHNVILKDFEISDNVTQIVELNGSGKKTIKLNDNRKCINDDKEQKVTKENSIILKNEQVILNIEKCIDPSINNDNEYITPDVNSTEFITDKSLAINHNHHHNYDDAMYHNCGMCQYRTIDKSLLAAHKLEVHTDLKPIYCKLCRYKCMKKSWLERHMKTHTKIFNCSLCPKVFLTSRTLASHKRSTHTNMYYCSLCIKKFPKYTTLLNHKRFKHKELDLICEVCKLVFQRHAYLVRHAAIHADAEIH